jgi:hypothetical protein
MSASIITHVLGDKNGHEIVMEILSIIEKHELRIGDARNVLFVADKCLNMVRVGQPLCLPFEPEQLTCIKGNRRYYSPLVTQTILQSERDAL